MVLGITGHRPDKLGGYQPNPLQARINDLMREVFEDVRPDKVITGMALGVDQWAAAIAISMGIPFIAAVPFHGQELKWPKESQRYYQELLVKAADVTVVAQGPYAPWKMANRNKWVVSHSDVMLAVWDGTDGGTHNCVDLIRKANKPMIRIDPTLV
jgi:uncharacterized phage-like protein YoqJ